jgi:4-diphosphocytidyl-2C-methyl-D-erythritol kinase
LKSTNHLYLQLQILGLSQRNHHNLDHLFHKIKWEEMIILVILENLQ